MLFCPAYKGITLASATTVSLAAKGRNLPFAFNRKEAKNYGEGGMIVDAKLEDKVVIDDDVIFAGTSMRESIEMILAANAQPAAVFIALDRVKKSGADSDLTKLSAVQEVSKTYQLPVITIANV